VPQAYPDEDAQFSVTPDGRVESPQRHIFCAEDIPVRYSPYHRNHQHSTCKGHCERSYERSAVYRNLALRLEDVRGFSHSKASVQLLYDLTYTRRVKECYRIGLLLIGLHHQLPVPSYRGPSRVRPKCAMESCRCGPLSLTLHHV
jgi:hypothetical protein